MDRAFNRYLQKQRMLRAAELLKDEQIKVQDIAELLGFSDNNYFSKAFRKFYDMSPSEYRQKSLSPSAEQ